MELTKFFSSSLQTSKLQSIAFTDTIELHHGNLCILPKCSGFHSDSAAVAGLCAGGKQQQICWHSRSPVLFL